MEIETNAIRRGRPPMQREEELSPKSMSPRELAAARTRELLAGGLNPSDSLDFHDDFHIDADLKDPDWSMEWKRLHLLGQEDPGHSIDLARAGWTPVPTKRFPQLMPIGSTEQNIIRRGMILMERPAEITNLFRDRDKKEAKRVLQDQEDKVNSTPQGHAPRDNQGKKLGVISKSFEAMPIPE